MSVPPKLTVSPVSSLIDEKNSISITGLEPNQPVTFYAQLRGDDNTLFHSHAHYTANNVGCISLNEQSSHGGSYTGVHPMGLLWSLELGPNEKKGCSLQKRNVETPYEVKVKALNGHLTKNDCMDSPNYLSECTFHKWYMKSNVQRMPVRDGRVRGTLFLPPGQGPFPGVIDMLGTGGGLAEFKASLFASHGFASLALAYFKYEDLPPTFRYLDMEYFEEALEWFCTHPKVQPGGVGVHANCKGGEIALRLASLRSEVSAVAAIGVPHGVSEQELSHKGKLVKCIGFDYDKVIKDETESIYCFKDCVHDMSDEVGTPVENIQGALLFIYGEDDQCYDVKLHKKKIVERLTKHNRKNFSILSYPGAGHLIEPPYTPVCSMSYHASVKMFIEFGGEPIAHAEAQEDYWEKVIKFFKVNIPVFYQKLQ